MRSVYSKSASSGYTPEANQLSQLTRQQFKQIIRNELENGSTPEAIEYVVFNAIHMELIAQRFYLQCGRNVDGVME